MKFKALLNLLLFVLGFVCLTTGCAEFKKVARTANDIATMVCQLTASEYTMASRDGLSPKEWCEIKEHLDPFIDHVLAAPMPAGMTKK